MSFTSVVECSSVIGNIGKILGKGIGRWNVGEERENVCVCVCVHPKTKNIIKCAGKFWLKV